jgi:hypothetical protein
MSAERLSGPRNRVRRRPAPESFSADVRTLCATAPLRGQVDGAPMCSRWTRSRLVRLCFQTTGRGRSPAKGLATTVDHHREEKE